MALRVTIIEFSKNRHSFLVTFQVLFLELWIILIVKSLWIYDFLDNTLTNFWVEFIDICFKGSWLTVKLHKIFYTYMNYEIRVVGSCIPWIQLIIIANLAIL